MVIFSVHFNQVRFEPGADFAEDGTKPLNGIAIENPAAIFRHKNQVDVHLKNTVPSVSNVIVVSHRPNYTIPYATSSSLQIRAKAQWRTAAQYASLRWVMSLRVQ